MFWHEMAWNVLLGIKMIKSMVSGDNLSIKRHLVEPQAKKSQAKLIYIGRKVTGQTDLGQKVTSLTDLGRNVTGQTDLGQKMTGQKETWAKVRWVKCTLEAKFWQAKVRHWPKRDGTMWVPGQKVWGQQVWGPIAQGRMRHSPKSSSPKPEGTKHVLVQRITSQRVKVQNFKGQSGQSPNSLSPKTDSPKQDTVQKVGSKKAMGLCPDRPKSDEARNLATDKE